MTKPSQSVASQFEAAFRKLKQIDEQYELGIPPKDIERLRETAKKIITNIQSRIRSRYNTIQRNLCNSDKAKKAKPLVDKLKEIVDEIEERIELSRESARDALAADIEGDADDDRLVNAIENGQIKMSEGPVFLESEVSDGDISPVHVEGDVERLQMRAKKKEE